jgi:hypothetical protein
MKAILDALWRAAAYCLHPRVIALSLLPLAVLCVLALGAGYFFWQEAVDTVRFHIEGQRMLSRLLGWLESMGMSGLGAMVAPLVVIALALPALVILSLLAVAILMTPAMVSLVGERRFPALEKKHGANMALGIAWSLGHIAVAIIALLASIPLWFVPPLILIVPPLIWGILTYRVLSYDVLQTHANKPERVALMREHRGALLGMGVVSGYLGAAPGLIWASGVMTVLFAPVIVPLAMWAYTLVFAFSSLWFSHYLLQALTEMRIAEIEAAKVVPQAEPGVPSLPQPAENA